jgi:hypothetical protein
MAGTVSFRRRMSRIDDLPPDRRAVLQLLLKQGKSYDDLASLLRIDPAAVQERAHDALTALGPLGGAGVPAEVRDEVADYLLGQQGASQRAATRELLETSAPARAWARIVSGELRPLAGDALPEIPSERAEVDEAFDALEARKEARARQAKSSRLGGVLLLVAIGIAVAFLIIFLVSSGSSDDSGTGGSTPAASSGTATTTDTGTGTTPQVLGQVNMRAPSGSGSKALAAVTLVRQGSETDIVFQGQGIPANKTGDVYALWLTGPNGPARLGFAPRVTASGRLKVAAALPSQVDVTKYTTMELTRETTATPKAPGTVVMSGPLRSG